MPAEQILERLMREYGDSVFRMCYLYLKDYYLAEDATQETFIKAMKSRILFTQFKRKNMVDTYCY